MREITSHNLVNLCHNTEDICRMLFALVYSGYAQRITQYTC